jgi:hypothetical protein
MTELDHKSRERVTVKSIGIRAFLYMILFAVIGLLPVLDITWNPFDREILFTEFSFVQFAQSIMLVIGIVATSRLIREKVLVELCVLFVFLLVCALVREADSFLDRIFDGLWQILIAILLAGAIYHYVKHKTAINEQIAWLGGHFSLGLMLAGFVIVTGFARVFGLGSMWKEVMGDQYTKTIKYFAEESVELLGYGILVVGIIEFSIAALRHFQHSHERGDVAA